MPSLYDDPYHPPNPPKLEEVQDGKLMTVLHFDNIECEVRRLSDRYFGVFEVQGAVFMTEGHDLQQAAEVSAESVANLLKDS